MIDDAPTSGSVTAASSAGVVNVIFIGVVPTTGESPTMVQPLVVTSVSRAIRPGV
ncbi:unannotated protein [freshwater metagenome]|uniref:Unannotated protein n=1 Tax=freshwater metagenome TaxID=449393 RepID=A0A6J7LAP6_9ZZZZ